MTTMYIVWAALIVFFAVAEGMTTQLVSIWFVIGSIAGLVSAFCGVDVWLQIVIAVAVSILMLVSTRPIVKKRLTPNVQSTNFDRCIGMDAIVIEDIDNIAPTGQVKVDGKVWTARSNDGERISADTIVCVEKIDGAKLIVSKK